MPVARRARRRHRGVRPPRAPVRRALMSGECAGLRKSEPPRKSGVRCASEPLAESHPSPCRPLTHDSEPRGELQAGKRRAIRELPQRSERAAKSAQLSREREAIIRRRESRGPLSIRLGHLPNLDRFGRVLLPLVESKEIEIARGE